MGAVEVCALFLAFIGIMIFMACGVAAYRSEQRGPEESNPTDLTLLSKEDYDFLVRNGLETTPEAEHHFYPPNQYRKIDGKWVNKLAWEQQRGINQQKELLAKARTEREYEELRPALIEAENAIRAKWIMPGVPKPVIIAGNPDGEHVRISSTGFYNQSMLRRN